MELAPEAWERLHDVRLRGMLVGPADGHVTVLCEAGYCLQRGERTVITPVGREAHAAWARIATGSESETSARAAYERFLLLDPEVKQVTTDWQLAQPNARPEGYGTEEWAIIDRLGAIDDRAGAILRMLGEAVPRFAGYRPRLRSARSRLEDGERQWFSGMTCDSYHTVWWQLHEDLLCGLGILRSEDPNQ